MNTPKARMSDLERFERIVALFKVERYVNIALSILSIVVLMWLAARLVSSDNIDWKGLASLFGPSGLFVYTTNRLLYMFNKGLTIVFGSSAGNVP